MKRLLFLLLALTGCVQGPAVDSSAEGAESVTDLPLRLEYACSQEERVQGLSAREELPESTGLLFVFPGEGVKSFWMKDMLFSIDILWLDSEKKITAIEESLQPCPPNNCPSTSHVGKYVLEVNSGKSNELGLKVGDRLKFEVECSQQAVKPRSE